MKAYLKYVILFVILVLIGVVGINLYNNNFFKSSFSGDNKTEEKEDISKSDTMEKEKQKENTEDNSSSNTVQDESLIVNNNESSGVANNSSTSTSNSSNTINNSTSSSNSNNNAVSSNNNESSTNNNFSSSNDANQNYVIDVTKQNANMVSDSNSETNSFNSSTTNNYIEIEVESNNSGRSASANSESATKTTYEELVIEANVFSSNETTSSSSVSNNNSDKTTGNFDNGSSNEINIATSNANSTSSNTVNTATDSSNDVLSDKTNTTSNDINSTSSNKTNTETNSSNSNTDKKVISDGNIIGATGYAALNSKLYLKAKVSDSASNVVLVEAGVPFRILAKNSKDTWWKVKYNGQTGWIKNSYCMINLPDYIPSITYNIVNAKSSIVKSSGVKLSITGKKLYQTGKVYNSRLSKNEYIVPVVYSFAKKILTAQEKALADGYSLKIYDAYRPVNVSKQMKDSLYSLYVNNSTVRNNINYSYDKYGNRSTWGQSWFIAQNLSAHNLGTAIDVSLTKKGSTKDLAMPTAMHELSTKAIKYSYGVSGQTKVRNDLYADTMTAYAKKLDGYMLTSGMTSLASEWWHFQDNTAYNRIKKFEGDGLDFQPTKIVSIEA